AGGADNFMRF
uniref:FMRFamide-8 n=1 Tax=Sarcophaga bullata TaxID=7385 RepID=FAR8_SARBU|nr:RecName: Full=FMRFamide-8; AltName: Full=SabFMRFamide-8 [Sarcophaga bullata]